MKLSFLTLSCLAFAVTATPVKLNFVEGDAPLEKRASETVYLSNCNILGTPVYSQINYYSNGANSQNGEQPDDTCYYPLSGYVNWEGNVVSCSFSGGATFTSHIDTDAQSRALYTYAGWGTNPYHSFNCYKDNFRLLYKFGSYPVTCYSVYYCRQA
ncbi:hypothetical protein VE03_08969 [Pseudogymnoascus sp. 23342-1-I1]|nr:hypothetical protein VE03_08969 [Pseudogymnoascus sp. 23342-1-I1]